MDVLNLFTSFLVAAWQAITSSAFTQWGFFGSFLFTIPIVRKLVKIFKNTF